MFKNLKVVKNVYLDMKTRNPLQKLEVTDILKS